MPDILKKLIDIISYMPGIGEKSATKLAFFLLKSNPAYLKNFSETLSKIQSEISECNVCYSLTDSSNDTCKICSSEYREKSIICVVEDYLDLVAIEHIKMFNGLYHVLGGAISPINGVLATDLKFKELFSRINQDIKEVIIATNPNIEGEATAMYIKENIPKFDGLKITRLSRGLPNSSSIEYADEITIINAFNGRV